MQRDRRRPTVGETTRRKRWHAAERFETVIIGGGQAGLATGYHLTRRGRSFVILDANERDRRPVAPALGLAAAVLAGQATTGSRACASRAPRNSFPTAHEMADYLEAYAARFELPVRSGDGRRRACEGRKSGTSSLPGTQTLRGGQRRRGDGRDAEAGRAELRVGARSADHAAPLERLPKPLATAGGPRSRGRREPLGSRHRLRGRRRARDHPVGTGHGSDPGFASRLGAGAWASGAVVPRVARPDDGHADRPQDATDIRHGGAPLLRYRQEGSAAAGVERVHARMVGVQDGLPVLDDGRVVDVANVIWCTGFRPDYSWIEVPFEVERGRLPGAVPRCRRVALRASTSSGLLFLHSFTLDAHRWDGQGRRAGRRAHRGAAGQASRVGQVGPDPRAGRVMSNVPDTRSRHERSPPSSAVLVWNGMVTRIRPTGVERPKGDTPTPTVRGADDAAGCSGARRVCARCRRC